MNLLIDYVYKVMFAFFFLNPFISNSGFKKQSDDNDWFSIYRSMQDNVLLSIVVSVIEHNVWFSWGTSTELSIWEIKLHNFVHDS